MSLGTANHPDPAAAQGRDAGLALRLPADAYYHLIRTLRLTLPPPLTDDPEDLLRRDHAAIARIAALAPANAAEADVAAQFVAASEQWKDCLRLAQLAECTPQMAAKCRAQALAMMRQTNSALRLLLRMQAAGRKIEANNAAADRLAWTEHCAIGLMAEALYPPPAGATPAEPGRAPCADTEVATQAYGAAPPPCEAEQVEEPAPATGTNARERVPETGADALAAAEEYATIYPERAALIRRMGRVPDDASFGPPDEDLVQALVSPGTPSAFPEARAA